MWVKICGNTNLEDAQTAAGLGADAVGFVFAPSVRQVNAGQVATITPHLPEGLERIGVFPAWPVEQIATAAEQAGLTVVQLHGELPLEEMRALRARLESHMRVVPVVSWKVGAAGSAAEVAARLRELEAEPAFDRVLIDSRVGAASGGTGVSFDWSAAREVFRGASQRLILAGGLRPENVAEAVRELAPWGVDVSSGVELEPGRKSPEKIAAFVRNARIVDR